ARPDPSRSVAHDAAVALLRIPHHGGAGDMVRAADGGVRLSAVAWEIVWSAMGAVGAAIELSAAVYRQHGGMDDGGDWASAVADLRADAHERRLFEHGVGRKRSIHADWLYGIVCVAGAVVHGADLSRDQPRIGRGQVGAGAHGGNVRARRGAVRWVSSGSGWWRS